MRFPWTSSPQPRRTQYSVSSTCTSTRSETRCITAPSRWREILANVLREPRCGGGIIAGDFNAINPEDHALVDKNELVDAWITLHGTADADEATWGFDVELRDGLAPGRLDKVAMLGVKAEKMEVLRPGFIEVPRPAEKPLKIPLE